MDVVPGHDMTFRTCQSGIYLQLSVAGQIEFFAWTFWVHQFNSHCTVLSGNIQYNTNINLHDTFLLSSFGIVGLWLGYSVIFTTQILVVLYVLKDNSGVDKIIVKTQPYQLLNTNREFFPSFDAPNFHKLVDESS